MRIFTSNKKLNSLAQEKAKQFVSQDLQRALYEYQVYSGMDLSFDVDSKNYISDGYESNADVFGIANKLASMFSNVPLKCFELGTENETENPLEEYFANSDSDYTFNEYLRQWELFNLIEGESADYIETIQAGNNQGKILNINLIPVQNMRITSGGWKEPIKEYYLDFNTKVPLKKQFVRHCRPFPNLDFTDGNNFRGLSPIKTASAIIQMQTNGYKRQSTLLKKGMPPGVLYKKQEGGYDPIQTEKQRKNMEAHWRRKYNDESSNDNLPLFTTGDIGWIQVGMSAMKDLQVIEGYKYGTVIICRVWGVPPQPFGDTSSSTYNNMLEAKKDVWEGRIMPDWELRASVWNKVLANDYYKKELRPDYSGVAALQEDLKRKAEILAIEDAHGKITDDEFREGMGRDPLTPEQITELQNNIDSNLIY